MKIALIKLFAAAAMLNAVFFSITAGVFVMIFESKIHAKNNQLLHFFATV
jgi:hypothetical protein